MAFVEIYRSADLAACEQRALVLDALAIPAQITVEGGVFALQVPEEARAAALGQLAMHEAENRARDMPPPRPRLHAHAWLGAAGYALTMFGIAWLAGGHATGADWYGAGALRGGFAHEGEWWRPVTALTLHADAGHLAANLAFGVFFGYFAGQMLGPGIAWLSVLTAAILGNVLNGLLMPPTRSSLGASTAVFATLGLVAAWSWRRGATGGRPQWARRWAPLVAGIALLGFTGTGGENTDVLAHLAGFAGGVLVGIAHARWPIAQRAGPRAQLIAGVTALLTVLTAWGWAILGTSGVS